MKVKIILFLVLFLTIPFAVKADYFGDTRIFFIEPDYDLVQREKINAILQKVSSKVYFYLDTNWWNSLDFDEQPKIRLVLDSLAEEFDEKIYPTLTSTFGHEWNPGIDSDTHITVLIHPMPDEAGGYYRGVDEYSQVLAPGSNEREMIYLNSKYLSTSYAKSFLTHEFMHLITFNQKERIQGVEEDVWLNEARSEYAPTLLGYDDEAQTSNLRRRVRNFLDKPTDSITEWRNSSSDYGALNLFTQYLVDHYGVKMLVNSLHSSKAGISSINEALSKEGFKADFNQVFTDWTVTVFVNDCALGEKYCYKNPNLKNFQVAPSINFLPMTGESVLSLADQTKNWAGNWYKFVGGKGTLKLEFQGISKANFKIPYLLQDSKGVYTLYYLQLDSNQTGTIPVLDFGKKTASLTIIPSVQSKISGFSGEDQFYQFSWTASTLAEQQTIDLLLLQIEFLKQEIARVQAQIDAILASRGQASCKSFGKDLYFGMMNNPEVICLQNFLKSKGSEIYPEGLVSGNFLAMTQRALQKYQAQKGITQTGYFGPQTRAAANLELSTTL